MTENKEQETLEVTHEEVSEHTLPLLPLKNVVILPTSITPIIVGRGFSIRAVEHALKQDRTVFITAQKDAKVEEPTLEDLYSHGTRATILQVMRMPNGALKILAEGGQRAKIDNFSKEDGFTGVTIKELPSTGLDAGADNEAAWRQLKNLYGAYAKLNERTPLEVIESVTSAEEMDHACDTIAMHITGLSMVDRQAILEQPHLPTRMLQLCTMLTKEIEILQMERKIRGHVQTQVEKSQREYYLTEQIKAIQKELGREDQTEELEQLRKKIKTLGLSKEAQDKVEKELRRLEQMPPLSSEAVISRHYIDWVTSVPWKAVTKDTISLKRAERILESKHAGLKKAKELILEFLAAKKFSKSLERSPIICLVGPPGVGKTSLGRSIAESVGRKFVRISLGGIRDEAEIRGHRRTYIGALPGKIIQAMRKAQTTNPVILLDEIDKMAHDMHGDPSAALLEVLDPEQNATFADHFLDVEYDLSKVMFITTANVLDNIPYPLFDRLEIINLAGYTDEEKMSIAKRFLIPKKMEEYELSKQAFKLPDAIVNTIITEYTREAGVRQLERVIAKLMRQAIQIMLKDKGIKSVSVTPARLHDWLGYPIFKKTSLSKQSDRVGLATGLAWTELGGDVMEIEIGALPGKGGLTLTGQLGEVMQESAQAAFSYVRMRAAELGIRGSFHTNKDIHIHIPEGATPKDGPSAGITICAALISALTKKPLKKDIAMTGEITLQGRVLSVGGLKEKLLAAKQHHMKMVIVPEENHDDIATVLKDTNLGDLKIIYVKTMDEALATAFEKNPLKGTKPVRRTKKK